MQDVQGGDFLVNQGIEFDYVREAAFAYEIVLVGRGYDIAPGSTGWLSKQAAEVIYTRDLITPTPGPLARVPITADNAGQVSELAVLTRGWINNLMWTPNGESLAVVGSAGVWFHDASVAAVLKSLD